MDDKRGRANIIAFQRCSKISDPAHFKKTFMQRASKFPRLRSHIEKHLGKFWFRHMPEADMQAQVATLMPTVTDVHNEK